jgi:hypothetical protein
MNWGSIVRKTAISVGVIFVISVMVYLATRLMLLAL